jgi:molecular chaperone GrpE
MSELKQDEILNEEIEKTQSCCESSKECCEGNWNKKKRV